MRNTRPVTSEEFSAFLAAYGVQLEQRWAGQALCYVDPSDPNPWPENMVASYLPATPTRRRTTGWRVVVDEPVEEPAEVPIEEPVDA